MLKTAIPFTIFLVIWVCYLSLPAFASYYSRRFLNQEAFELQALGKLDEAIKSYERAINLDPDFAPSHYNLGAAFEVLGDYDKAISEYQTTIRLSPTFYYAYNNLARLFLLRRNDPASALRLLNDALDVKPQEAAVNYTIFKNRGWAHLNLKCYGLAVSDLKEALKWREDGAAAYCLLAQSMEALGKPGAKEAWESCVSYKAGQEHEIEINWLSLAQERLTQEPVEKELAK
jgi:tetratricopeptide (TPR) repeat protein